MKENKSETFILDDNDNDALPLIKPIENEEELREKALQRKKQIEETFKDDLRKE